MLYYPFKRLREEDKCGLNFLCHLPVQLDKLTSFNFSFLIDKIEIIITISQDCFNHFMSVCVCVFVCIFSMSFAIQKSSRQQYRHYLEPCQKYRILAPPRLTGLECILKKFLCILSIRNTAQAGIEPITGFCSVKVVSFQIK